jgi:Domain of unknown function (DUF4352)
MFYGLAGIIALGVVVSIFSGDSEETSGGTGGTEKVAEKKEETKEYKIGEEVAVGNLAYVVNGVEETNKLSSILGEKTTEGKFVVVDLTVKNNDKEARIIDGEMFRIIGSDGTEYSSNLDADTYVNDDIGFFLQEVNPKMSKTGKVVFEVPADETGYKLQVSSGLGWSGGEYQTINLGK